MKIKYQLILLVISSIFLFSCSKKENNTPVPDQFIKSVYLNGKSLYIDHYDDIGMPENVTTLDNVSESGLAFSLSDIGVTSSESDIISLDFETKTELPSDHFTNANNKRGIFISDTPIRYIQLIPEKHDVLVAVLDTGIDMTHPVFEDSPLVDLRGRNFDYIFVEGVGSIIADNDDLTDEKMHGTIVAAFIASNRYKYWQSINSEKVKILPVKKRNEKINIMASLEYIDNFESPIDFVNCSFSLRNEVADDEMDALFQKISDEGTIFISSAGNTNDVHDYAPQHYPFVIGIGGLDRYHDEESQITSYGFNDFMTYMDRIRIPDLEIDQYEHDDFEISTGATSFAAPIITGIMAKIKSFDYSLDRESIVSIMAQHTNDVPGFSEHDGHGKLDYKALAEHFVSFNHYSIQRGDATFLVTTVHEKDGSFIHAYLEHVYVQGKRYLIYQKIN